jgi:type IV secretory pathway TraG/TraD family ATPase VirD4
VSIQKLTGSTDINLKDFTNKPTALFLTLADQSDSRYKLASVYNQLVLKACINIPGRESNPDVRPIMQLGDEVGNIPPIAGLGNLITTGLSKKIRVMLVFQSEDQLFKKYPEDAKTIEENCELMVLIKTRDEVLIKKLSKAFGTKKIKEKVIQTNKTGETSGTSTHMKEVPVLSEKELNELPTKHKVLV